MGGTSGKIEGGERDEGCQKDGINEKKKLKCRVYYTEKEKKGQCKKWHSYEKEELKIIQNGNKAFGGQKINEEKKIRKTKKNIGKTGVGKTPVCFAETNGNQSKQIN